MERNTVIVANDSQHSDLVQEIISQRPSFVIRRGISVLCILFLLVAAVCWIVQYPELVVAQGRLNSVYAPKGVVSRADGKLLQITIHDNDKVVAGQVLGRIESIANPQSVKYLSGRVDLVNSLLDKNRDDELVTYFYNPPDSMMNLGELQAPYQTFTESFTNFKAFLSKGFYLKKMVMLQTDLENAQKLHTILAAQKDILQQDLSLSDETFKANELLQQEKVISPLDYRNEKSKLLAKQLSLPQVNAQIVADESLQNDKYKEMAELENQIRIQRDIFFQSVQTLKSQIQSWEFKYLLKAPVSGTISFAGFFQENQEMKTGQTLFYVQPEYTSFFMAVLIPQYNFGKIKKGQQVLLRFQAYPFEQYGSVTGMIDYINDNPTDSGFLAKVILPNGLLTNNKKVLQYRYGLMAQADIITENVRLLERLYYNIYRQVGR